LIFKGENLDYKKASYEIEKIIKKSKNVLEDVVKFLYKNFDYYSWVGIYINKSNDLILGPWRGPQATEHTKIPIRKGICGSAAKTGKTEIIADVNSDDRYLSCFVSTKSEIVVPIKKYGKIVGEIDIDSDVKNAFKREDKTFLEKVADMLSEHI
jgi:L-methionine (R)-S-oxide reductase